MMDSRVDKGSGAASYALRPRPPLVAGISDYSLSLIIPVVAHWLTAAVYEIFQYFDLFPQYRIHTSKEEAAKNTISRLQCLRRVVLVQILQTAFGLVLGAFGDVEMTGHEDRHVMIWASRVHDSGQAIRALLPLSSHGLETLADTFSRSVPFKLADQDAEVSLLVAKLIYYGLLPAMRFYAALWLADTWVFFIHRAEHSYPWLYRTFHAHHHELNVPYSWGGIYDHPLESLFLGVGAFIFAVIGSGMSLRESMVFSAFSSAKACSDHGGYDFPWNPMDMFTTVGASYHDKHHQRWGYKTNFALHFQFWDRVLGTEFTDAEAAARLYRRDRDAAEVAWEGKRAKVKSS